MNRIRFAVLSVSILLAACSTVGYTDKYAPTEASSVEVVTLSQLQKPYEIIGEITGNPVLENMGKWKTKAAQMGADAISIPAYMSNGYVKLYVIKWKQSN